MYWPRLYCIIFHSVSHYPLSLSGASFARLVLRLCANGQAHISLLAIAAVSHREVDLQHNGLAHWLRVNLTSVPELVPNYLAD